MYLAYSALRSPSEDQNTPHEPLNQLQLRYQAYQTICNKYSSHIVEIQKYFPGWWPGFGEEPTHPVDTSFDIPLYAKA